MLELSNRKALTEVLFPKPGYELKECVILTYSADVYALSRIILALNGLVCDGNEEEVKQRINILIRQTLKKRNIHVFINKTGYSCNESKVSPIMKTIDDLICEINYKGGSFHPKLIIAKYNEKNCTKHSYYILICGSKNITESEFIESGMVLEGVSKKRVNAFSAEVEKFISGTVDKKNQSIAGFLYDLKYVKFEEDEIEFVSQIPNRNEIGTLGIMDGADKVAIISPFVDDAWSENFIETKAREKILISTKHALDGLKAETFEIFGKNIFYMVEEKGEVDEQESSVTETFTRLHSKIFFIEKGKKKYMLVGSANATSRAWNGVNAECLIKVVSNYGINDLKKEFIYEVKRDRILRGYLRRYDVKNRVSNVKEKKMRQRELRLIEFIKSLNFSLYINKDNEVIVRTTTGDSNSGNFCNMIEYDLAMKVEGCTKYNGIISNSGSLIAEQKFGKIERHLLGDFIRITHILSDTAIYVKADTSAINYKTERLRYINRDTIKDDQSFAEQLQYILDKKAHGHIKYGKKGKKGWHNKKIDYLDIFPLDKLLSMIDRENIQEVEELISIYRPKNTLPEYIEIISAHYRKGKA